MPQHASPAFAGKSRDGVYGDAIEELDWSTGEILERLRTLGLAERTLVIFTSDNGPERNTPGTAAPLRGTKHTVFEGGLRVPFIAWWPGTLPAGRVSPAVITARCGPKAGDAVPCKRRPAPGTPRQVAR